MIKKFKGFSINCKKFKQIDIESSKPTNGEEKKKEQSVCMFMHEASTSNEVFSKKAFVSKINGFQNNKPLHPNILLYLCQLIIALDANLDSRALLLTEREKSSGEPYITKCLLIGFREEQSKASLIGAFMLARGVSRRRKVPIASFWL